MAGSRRIQIQFIGDSRGIDSTASHVESRMSRMGSRLRSVGRIAGLGLAAGLGAAAVGAVKLGQAAAEDQQQAALLARQMRNSAGATREQVAATEDWITKQGISKGVADDQLRPALMNLVRSTHDVGQAQRLAGLAMDISAASGRDLGQVSLALARAQTGNVGALGRLGIATKDAQGKTLTFEQITAKLADTFGGAATTKANTFQGRMDRLRLVLSETGESIGYKLLPIANRLATWFLAQGLPAMQRFGGWMSDHLGPIFHAIGDFIGNKFLPFIRDLRDRFMDAAGGTSGLHRMMRQLQPTVRVLGSVLHGLWVGLGMAARITIPLLVGAFRVLIPVLNSIARVVRWLWNGVFAPVLRLIVTAVANLLEKWSGLLHALGKVPGFGWAEAASRNMHDASVQARHMSDNIKDIPKNWSSDVYITEHVRRRYQNNSGIGGADPYAYAPRRAMGGPVRAGRAYVVGERRPELFVPNQNGRIEPRVAGGAPVVINFNGLVTDPKAAAREVRKILLDLKRQEGGRPLGIA